MGAGMGTMVLPAAHAHMAQWVHRSHANCAHSTHHVQLLLGLGAPVERSTAEESLDQNIAASRPRLVHPEHPSAPRAPRSRSVAAACCMLLGRPRFIAIGMTQCMVLSTLTPLGRPGASVAWREPGRSAAGRRGGCGASRGFTCYQQGALARSGISG